MAGGCLLHLMLVFSFSMQIYALIHVVGNTDGWVTGVDYNTWATVNTFVVGDILVFNYRRGEHTVDEVTESDYSNCSVGKSITSDSSGLTTMILQTPGTYYFICAIGGHCDGGMKISITVRGDGSRTIPTSIPNITSFPRSVGPPIITISIPASSSSISRFPSTFVTVLLGVLTVLNLL